MMQAWIRETSSFFIDEERPIVEEIENGIYIVRAREKGGVYCPDTGFSAPPSSTEEVGYE